VDKNLTLKVQSVLGAPLEALAPWARLVPAVKGEHMSECEEVRFRSYRSVVCVDFYSCLCRSK
jgi:hypothetical protein